VGAQDLLVSWMIDKSRGAAYIGLVLLVVAVAPRCALAAPAPPVAPRIVAIRFVGNRVTRDVVLRQPKNPPKRPRQSPRGAVGISGIHAREGVNFSNLN